MKHTIPFLMGRAGLIATAALAAATSGLFAGATTISSSVVTEESEKSAFEEWWEGKYMTGNWFGVRDTLAENGLTFRGKWNGAFYGVVDSQRGSRGFFDQEISFDGDLNFGKLLKVEALDGVTAFAGVRWRDSRTNSNPNTFVQANSLFNPSHFQSGTQWRLLTFGLEISSKKFLPVEDMIVLRGGWLRPQKEFIDQPLSKLFLNNAIESAKGIGGNIPFSSSFSTWGGTLQVKPVDWHYVKAGLFMAFPNATASSNHGLAFSGYAPDPSRNGLMVMGETGFTPKIGPSKLPGRYAFGGYYFGVDKPSFDGTPHDGQYGFYWQFDQMLFREPSEQEEAVVMAKGPSDGKSVAGGKSLVGPVAPSKPKLSKQGLSTFNLISFAPDYNNLFPFYFQSGLVYEGLIPSRDKDLTMFAIAFGNYSYANIEQLQADGKASQPNYTIVLEWDYRIQINGWAFFQPFVQYLIQPAGTGAVANATVLGFLAGVNF